MLEADPERSELNNIIIGVVGHFYLGNVNLPGIHELQNSSEMLEWDVLQDYDWVLGRVFL